jgi:hypothetical protein
MIRAGGCGRAPRDPNITVDDAGYGAGLGRSAMGGRGASVHTLRGLFRRRSRRWRRARSRAVRAGCAVARATTAADAAAMDPVAGAGRHAAGGARRLTGGGGGGGDTATHTARCVRLHKGKWCVALFAAAPRGARSRVVAVSTQCSGGRYGNWAQASLVHGNAVHSRRKAIVHACV